MFRPAVTTHGKVKVSLPELELSRHTSMTGRLSDFLITLLERHDASSAWYVEVLDCNADVLEALSVPSA